MACEKHEKFCCEVLPHPAYSQEFTTSDFYLFEPLKHALSGKRFANEQKVDEAVRKWLQDQPNESANRI